MIKGLTNKLHAYALVWKKTGYMQSFRFIGAMVSEFGFFKKRGLMSTSLEENWFTCKISGSLVLWLVSFASSKRRSSEVKGLTNKLYAYWFALLVYMQNLNLKKKMKKNMDNLCKSCLPVFHTSCDIFMQIFANFTCSPP